MPMTLQWPEIAVRLRLPLGILCGVGFIGAGAIIHRESLVFGVTTAARWFVTVIGLCFGAGQIPLGLAASFFGVIILSGLKRLELNLKQERQATLAIIAGEEGPGDDDICSAMVAEGFKINSYSIVYGPAHKNREVTCYVQWRGRPTDTRVPPPIRALANHPGVIKVAWTPRIR